MESERVVYVGGPLDGQVGEYPSGMALIQIPVAAEEDGPVTHHRYGQADFIRPEEVSHSLDGARRYIYLGEGEPPE